MRRDRAAARLLHALLLAPALSLHAAEGSAQVDAVGQYAIEGTAVHTLVSAQVGDTFQVAVAPPLVPDARGADLPLVLMTDADLAFGATAQIVRLMQLRSELPPFLLVGVGYGSIQETQTTRARDLTPVDDPEASICRMEGCGGAERFLAFIEEELIPFLRSRYPISGDVTFYGASLGGLFGAYTLLRGSRTFRRWVLGSPAVAFADFAVLDATRLAGPSPGPPVADAVFVGVGGEEGSFVANARRLVEVLQDRGLASTVILEVFEGERHMSVQPMVVAHGLRTVFQGVPPEVGGGR